MYKKLILILLIISSSYASKLHPIPFQKQLNESEGIVYGKFLGKSFKRMHDGKVVTEASFKVLKSIGIENRYLVNRMLFKVYYDGGTYQGFEYHNKNAPTFDEDRSYVILLKRDSFGFRPYMEKLGVYTINENKESNFLVSQAFPDHPKFGVMPYLRFDLWVRTIYGSHMEETHSDKYVSKRVNRKIRKGRVPASAESESAVEDDRTLNILWLTLAFGFLGAVRMRKIKALR